MASLSESLRPTYEKKTSNSLKADRVKHRVTFNPNKASPGETLRIAVLKLEEGVVLVPSSLAPHFNLNVSGHANNFLVNNVARALVSRLKVKFAGEVLQDTDAFGMYTFTRISSCLRHSAKTCFSKGSRANTCVKYA